MSKNTDNQPATKNDLVVLRTEIRTEIQTEIRASEKRITENIGTEIGLLLSDAMTIIGEHFMDLKNEFQEMKTDFRVMKTDINIMKGNILDLQNGQTRIENKLNATIDTVDDLSVRTRRLEARAT
ncbi:MAG TPA: hypothetical protein VNX65_01710 [Patescibacteria group bacterium]|jgi:hypothetical protein|nr:hypothetical protein [Patescibacteria group bacterium]